MRVLSKSKLLAFRQCPKRLWLEIHRPEAREESRTTQAAFRTGHEVGIIAQRLYDPATEGAVIDWKAEGMAAALERSRRLLTQRQPIFEAGFSAGGGLAFADVNGDVVPDLVESRFHTIAWQENHFFDAFRLDARGLGGSGQRRRGEGEPLQHLLGTVEFGDHEFVCDHRGLIPRPETEYLVEFLLKRLAGSKPARILDVGTGSGCLGISLALATGAPTVLVDISEDALDLARLNVSRLAGSATIQTVRSDLFEKVTGTFDLYKHLERNRGPLLYRWERQDNTVTAGIVSAKQRDTGDYLPFIQTDVAINPGNSGGPLINMRGEVVGINSQIYSRSGGFMGISFAIPIDEAMQVSDQLRATGRVTRGRIGVQIGQVTRDVAESIGLGKQQGALVTGVESGSPADKAGIEAGDIIIRFDGKSIDKLADLPRMVGNTKPGTKSTVTVFRRGQSKDLSIVIAEVEPDKTAVKTSDREPRSKSSAAAQQLGLTISDLSEAQKKELKLRGGVRVDAASDAAARAGLREGDVILAIANAEVANVKDFEAAVARADKGKPVNVLFRRGEWAQYALIRPSR